MKKRPIIILLLMSAAIIGVYSVSYAVIYQDWSFYTYDGNGKEILFYVPETELYYNKYDPDGSLRERDTTSTIYIKGTTIRDVKSTNEDVAFVIKDECIGSTKITVYRRGGGSCKIKIRGAAPDANGNYWQECPVLADPTPFKLARSFLVFSNQSKGLTWCFGNVYEGHDSYVTKAKSSNTNAVKIKTYSSGTFGSTYVFPVKPGKAKVTIYDNNGRSRTVTVTVKKKYFKSIYKNLKKDLSVAALGKKIYVWGAPVGTKITIKLKGKIYKGTIKTTEVDPAVIKIKQKLKKGTKMKITLKFSGYKITKTLTYKSYYFE